MTVPQLSRLGWYARRAARMSPAEVAWRARDQAVQLAWSRHQVRPEQLPPALPPRPGQRSFTAVLPGGTAGRVPAAARAALLAAADRLMRGEWEVLGVARTDLVTPDWFRDPVTGHRSSPDRYAFRINQRSEEQVGNVKQVWEISRLQHLTVLATAWFLTGDEPLRRAGSAISCGPGTGRTPSCPACTGPAASRSAIRLISLAWIRRLLDGWPGVAGLFEDDGLAVQQIRWHQRYLDGFRSRGSSANNHVIAEAAGQLVASCAFPWFAGKRALAAEIRASPRARTAAEHVPVGHRPRARLGLPELRRGARAAGGGGGGGGRPSARRSDLATALRDDRQRRRPGRRAGAGASSGRRRRRPRAAARRSGRPAAAGRRCWRSVTRCSAGCDWWPPVTAGRCEHARRRSGRCPPRHPGPARAAALAVR